MSEIWKDSRAEASMREAGRVIMKDAANKKAKEELLIGKVISQFEVSVVSHGEYNEEDLMLLVGMIDQLKNTANQCEGLELTVNHLR